MTMGKVIFTVFAGRRRYMEILLVYINKLQVDEVHIWDYSKCVEDEIFLDSCGKSVFKVNDKNNFREYYEYYNKERYPEDDTVLIKCDDDIVFIDVCEFNNFIEYRRRNKDAFIVSPMVINNPLCNYIFYENNNFFSGEYAYIAHEHFINNLKNVPSEIKTIPNDIKFNINFISILSTDFDVFQSKYNTNDEFFLGLVHPMMSKRPIVIYGRFVVSHMAFGAQRLDGYDESEHLQKYASLAREM